MIQMLSMDNWFEVMTAMVDAKEVDQMPERDHQTWWALFAISYMLVGGVVIVGMYICILFECFYAAKLEYCGAVNCNVNEQQWINIQRFMLRRSIKYQASDIVFA